MTNTTTIGTNGASDHIAYLWLGNGGQIVVQTNVYAHSFDRAGEAAMVIGDLLLGEDTSGWDGDDPDARVDVEDPAYDTNGNDIIHIVKGDTVESLAKECWDTEGHAARDLARMLAPATY